MSDQPRMMTDEELAECGHTLEVLLASNRAARDPIIEALAGLLSDAEASRAKIETLTAELRVAKHLGPR